MSTGPQLLGDSKLDAKLVEGHVKNETAKIERGILGSFFGSSSSIPANIAAVIATVASLALIAAIITWAGATELSKKDGVAALSALVTLALGYLFGRASKP